MSTYVKALKAGALSCCVALLLTVPVAAQQSFTTLFGILPNPGGATTLAPPGQLSTNVGEFPDVTALNGLEAFTSFNVQNLNDGSLLSGSTNEGQNIFLQNANFYVGGGQIFPVENGPEGAPGTGVGPIAQQQISSQGQTNLAGLGILDTDGDATNGLQTFNNRIFGVFGTGRSDIVFQPGIVTELILQAGITSAGTDVTPLTVGTNDAFGQSLPAGTPLADGDGTLLIYTDLGLEATISLADVVADRSNAFDVINQDLAFGIGDVIGSDTIDGDSITRISIINQSSALNSAAFLSELTVNTSIPEPNSLALLCLGCLGMLKRRW